MTYRILAEAAEAAEDTGHKRSCLVRYAATLLFASFRNVRKLRPTCGYIFPTGSFFCLTNITSNHSLISILTSLNYTHKIRTYLKHSIITKHYHVRNLLRPQWPEYRRPPKLRALQSSRRRQSLLRNWPNLSHQWALHDAVWSILQRWLYR